jgi:hypothetical protein
MVQLIEELRASATSGGHVHTIYSGLLGGNL